MAWLHASSAPVSSALRLTGSTMKRDNPSRRTAIRLALRPRTGILLPSACALGLLFPASDSFAQETPATSTQTSNPTPVDSLTPVKTRRSSQAAADAYLEGARALDKNNLALAETQFTKAANLNPRNPDYVQALALTREHRVTDLVQQAGKARLLGHNTDADALLAQARTLDPQNAIVSQHFTDPGPLPASFTPARTDIAFTQPIVLAPTTETQSFHLNEDIQQVLTRVATAYGIRPVFDSSVVPLRLRFDLENTTYDEAVPILFEMGRLFSVPLDAHSVLIAKDTPANRQRLERQVEETIYLPAFTVEQRNDLSAAIRSIFDLKQVTVQNNLGAMVVRAPESVITAMNKTLADLIDGGAEVMLDVKLYSVDKTRTRRIGVQVPQQIGIYNVEGEAHNLVSANQTLVNQAIAQGLVPAGSSDTTIALALIASGLVTSTLLSNTLGFFGGGLTMTGVTTNATPTFSLALNSSDTRILDDIHIRVGDRQAAIFRAGSRYPITTSTYSFGSSSATTAALAGVTINGVSAASLLSQYLGSGSSTTIPQIQYEDLGITLKATPTVQKSHNIAFQLELKIQSLAGGSANNIPVLSSRLFTSNITIPDGQTAMMVSSLSKTESGAVSGIPGLGELPGFQAAAADKTTELNSSDLVLLITPHIVRQRSDIISGPRIAINLPSQQD
ncbi:hypothetical protein BH10ACI4_BH10ACI4_09240 [soil metagenome]